MNVCLPVFMFGVVPLSLVLWIWHRKQRTLSGGTTRGPVPGRPPKSVTIWVMLAMTAAIAYLGFMCWAYSYVSPGHLPKTRFLSTSEIQDFIANPQVRKFHFRLYQTTRGARRLSGDLLENGKVSPFVAPAEDRTMTLLAEKGVGYATTVENQDARRLSLTYAGWWAQRLLTPFCCFILVAGAVTWLRGSHNQRAGPLAIPDRSNERHVDKTFAALAACGMVALAVFHGATTDWKVRTIPAYQLPSILAQHKHARFEVFEYPDGSRKLWISDRHTPDFIAPANGFTLGVLTDQGITYQTYLAGKAGLTGPSQIASLLWMLALTAGAGILSWWVVKSRPVSRIRAGTT